MFQYNERKPGAQGPPIFKDVIVIQYKDAAEFIEISNTAKLDRQKLWGYDLNFI